MIQAVRLDIAGELEAICLYDAHVQATDSEIAKKVLSDIRDEEKAHIGELMTLLRTLDPQEAELFAGGEAEVREMLGELERAKSSGVPSVDASNLETVGSLLKKQEQSPSRRSDMGRRSVTQQLKRTLVDSDNAERVTWQRHEKLELEIRVFGREVS